MKRIKIKAFAKINLRLKILDKLDNGYHRVETILQRISLSDVIAITKSDDFQITSDNPRVPVDETNTVYKAWKILGAREPVHIHIEKNIPFPSGLGGESADAAATLKGLDKLWNLNLSVKELLKIGAGIGMDTPFCIMGGTARGANRGELIRPLPFIGEMPAVISAPEIKGYPSTRQAYENFDREFRSASAIADDESSAFEPDNFRKLGAERMVNSFEKSIFPDFPEIKIIKEKMLARGAVGSLMSGHGPSVYGVFSDQAKAARAFEKFKEESSDTFLCRTIPGGAV